MVDSVVIASIVCYCFVVSVSVCYLFIIHLFYWLFFRASFIIRHHILDCVLPGYTTTSTHEIFMWLFLSITNCSSAVVVWIDWLMKWLRDRKWSLITIVLVVVVVVVVWLLIGYYLYWYYFGHGTACRIDVFIIDYWHYQHPSCLIEAQARKKVKGFSP